MNLNRPRPRHRPARPGSFKFHWQVGARTRSSSQVAESLSQCPEGKPERPRPGRPSGDSEQPIASEIEAPGPGHHDPRQAPDSSSGCSNWVIAGSDGDDTSHVIMITGCLSASAVRLAPAETESRSPDADSDRRPGPGRDPVTVTSTIMIRVDPSHRDQLASRIRA